MSVRFLFFFLAFLIAAPAMSQGAAALQKADRAVAASGEGWRDVGGYRFPALASTVAAAQNMAQAMILRDYCANAKVPDDFVRERLARFSRITGREENCQSLLDY